MTCDLLSYLRSESFLCCPKSRGYLNGGLLQLRGRLTMGMYAFGERSSSTEVGSIVVIDVILLMF